MHRMARFGTTFLHAGSAVAWVLCLVLLPITSLPLLSALTGHTVVAPASLIPLGWLSVWLAIYLIRGRRVPRESLPLIFFCSLAILSSTMAFFLPIPSFKNKTVLDEETSALATVAIGVLFYLVTASWLYQQPARLTSTLRWISLGGALTLLWAVAQGIYIFALDSRFPGFLVTFHRLFSIRDFSLTRMTAFAYEPSWLAHQLNILYLPLWLSATLQGWSAFSRRPGGLSTENILLVIGSVVVLLSSRVGALSFFLVLFTTVVCYSLVLVRKVRAKILSRMEFLTRRSRQFLMPLLGILLSATLLGLYLLLTLVILRGLAQVDPRLQRLWQLPSWLLQQPLSSLNPYLIYLIFRYLAFAERYVYWVTGWRVFSQYPLLGVGLGNTGFFFPTELPAYGWNLTEVIEYFYQSPYLPNIKSFWIRLLAETGIAGFSAFLTWYLVIWASARFLRQSDKVNYRVIGWAGLFVLVAFLTEGFSVDTFALPYLWVSLGMVSAMAAAARQENQAHQNHLETS